MAEAVVEDRPQQPQRFYCHLCSVEIENISTDYTCPLCSGGFIEELPTTVEQPAPADVDMTETDPNYFDLNHRLTDEISSLLMSVTGARPMPSEASSGDSQPNNTTNRGERRSHRFHNIHNFDNFLQEFLISVTGGGGPTGTPMFFLGNPGDYAWGREGLDTIVTQLLNQMEGTGPPPLATDKIAEIPKVEVSQDQVDSKLQCSVCWEDFQLNELVRQLTCSHVYHENCIVPWLELHGTCPICRKTLFPESEEYSRNSLNTAAAIAANTIRNSLYRADSENAGSSSGSSSQQNPENGQQRNRRNDEDDGNVEFDFD